MSHEIYDANYGGARFAYSVSGAGRAWWEGMSEDGKTLRGIPMMEDASAEDYILATGLDFEVKREKAFANIGGKNVYSGYDILYRQEDYDTDPVQYSVIPNDWKTVDHKIVLGETVDQFVSIARKEGFAETRMESMGGLFNGQLAFSLVFLGEGFKILGRDETRQYLMFANRHKYGTAIQSVPTDVRVECWNTFSAAVASDGKNSVKANHRIEFNSDLVLAKIAEVHKFTKAFEERAEFLSTVKINDEKLKEYFGGLFPVVGANKKGKELSRTATQCLEYFDNQPGASLGSGTWWNAFNSVTHHLDHIAARTVDTRIANSFFGTGVNVKAKALERALEYAEAA
jgi:phage/plasmid-like protein (TIGR03299 family)